MWLAMMMSQIAYNRKLSINFENVMAVPSNLKKQNVINALQNQVYIVLQGQTTPEARYFFYVLTCFSRCSPKHQWAYLTISSVAKDATYDVKEHVRFPHYFKSVFEEDVPNAATLIGGDCNANEPISTKKGALRIGRANYLFQIAVKIFLADVDAVILQVKQLEAKLWTPLIPAKL